MSRRGRSWQSVVVALGLVFAGSAQAHVEQRSGPYRVTMGWRDEPPYSGAPNAVEVDVADRAGAAVEVSPGVLDVEVTFGGSAAVTSLPLPSSGGAGKLGAAIIPTRPGTHAIHAT